MLTRDSEHRYYWSEARVPGVTEVLKSVGLVDDRWYTEESSYRGRFVHAACELLVKDDLDWSTVRPEYEGYLRSFTEWYKTLAELRRYTNTVLLVHRQVFNHNLWYAGEFDFLFGALLLDWKTGDPEPWAQLQTAAYMEAARSEGLDVEERGVLRLYEDGRPAKLILHADEGNFRVFTHALSVHNWRRNHGG